MFRLKDQFQTKFTDEPRPKAGLMRTREFTMKDSYVRVFWVSWKIAAWASARR